MAKITESARTLDVLAEADVVVAGGGPGGFPAAIAAARQGARTVLLERYGFLGGMATAGLIGPILGHRVHNGEKAILGGIPRELCDRLHQKGGAPPWAEALKAWGVRFEPEIMKVVLDEMVAEANVQVFLHTLVAGAVMEDGAIRAIIVESKSGRQAIVGKTFVDATGDADVAFRAGAATHMGRRADGRPMSMGSMFRVGGVRPLSSEERKAGAERVEQARERSEIHAYSGGIETRSSTLRDDTITPNMTRFAGDATDVESLTRGEIAVRADTWRIVLCYRKNVPGYEGAYLASLPTHIGLRESRQIEGLYALTGKDIVEARRFDDVVALGSWWIDIHCPLGRTTGGVHVCETKCPSAKECGGQARDEGLRPGDLLARHGEDLPDRLHPPDGGWYDIPCRCLVPKGIKNLLASGRCISATHQGMAGARVMGTCMAIGQAAGAAAALAADKKTPVGKVDGKELQAALRKAGALLQPE